MSDTKLERDYRSTLNLPKTAFPMKADLPQREPGRVEWWSEHRTYQRRLDRNKGNGPWILHDGPPYANGDLHVGHFLNMVLKDIFVKIALLDGKWAAFIPGWDMHGLPIERETLSHLNIQDFHAIDPLELRAQCRVRAEYWMDRQCATRMRMGAFGDWEHPYRTIDPEFEATIVDAVADLVQNEQIYRGLRSTLWCTHDETALAEAEIEYRERVSPSIIIRFTATPAQRDTLFERFGVSDGPDRVSFLIWTTTPWTLPANAAIALRPEAWYGLYRVGEEAVIVAEALAPRALASRFASAHELGRATGDQLNGTHIRHPLFDRDSVVVVADYVDLETGTGAVHTAPGHGADDFDTGLRFNLPIINPVDARGVFTSEGGPYAGLLIWRANPKIVQDLHDAGALWDAFEYTHSYPHCWRCKNPVIFRATAQWFIAMDQNRLRRRTIDNVRTVDWTPAWGEARIAQMLENHPEWCLSRQRTWGTPIPAVRCIACGDSILSVAVARLAAKRFREASGDAWWRDPVENFLPPGMRCPQCSGDRFEKEFDIVDIWFESGVTHLAVLGRSGLPWPADLVLEGGDQYRGWFRSSIVTATAIKHAAPYRHVVKNGWVNDEYGHPMSKSLGTGMDAGEAMQRWGADVLRLWAASVEFVDDVRFGPNVIEQVSRVYRNLRNRVRFMLSNLEDLPPEAIVPREEMRWFDAIACEIADAWASRVRDLLKSYRLHDAFLEIVRFEGEDLSSFYLDALKDRLYAGAPHSRERRSAQSALLHVLDRFLCVLAPLISFTAEEAWQCLSEGLRFGRESVFDLQLISQPHAAGEAQNDWDELKRLRAWVAATEGKRDYELRAHLEVSPDWNARLGRHLEDVREAMVVSALDVTVDAESRGDHGIRAQTLSPAEGSKCARCWKYLPLGTDPLHPMLCAPCAATVRELES